MVHRVRRGALDSRLIDLDVTLSINWGDLQMLPDFTLNVVNGGFEPCWWIRL
jgi:hypothetical protein